MTRYPHIAALLGATLLTACNGATVDDGNSAATEPTAETPAANRVSDAPTPSASANPVTLQDKSDALEFEYTVPARAAAIPELREMLLTRAKRAKEDALAEQAKYAEDLPADAPVHAYELTTDWSVAAETSQLLVLIAEGYDYRGGAHGMPIHKVLYWDKASAREIGVATLFTDRDDALATVREAFCTKLDEERAKKRGITVAELKKSDDGAINSFTACPPFDDQIPVAFTHVVGGKFGRIRFIVPPYVAGAYAEGDYTVELTIPKAMIAFVADRYRPSFPGTGN